MAVDQASAMTSLSDGDSSAGVSLREHGLEKNTELRVETCNTSLASLWWMQSDPLGPGPHDASEGIGCAGLSAEEGHAAQKKDAAVGYHIAESLQGLDVC